MEQENTNEQPQDNVETTTEQSSEETQQAESQSSEQVDTPQEDSKVSESMGIQEKEEASETATNSPTLDEIVEEAMSGELSEETQKFIDENGLGKHLDLLVQGHQAIQEKNNNEVFSVVGGKESYSELQEWGQNNMSKEQQEAFNEALFSGNINLAKLAVQGLQAQYVAANGKSPDRVIQGGDTSNSEGRPFSHVNEYLKITQTQQYKRNPEYRAQVEAKRNKSGF